MQLDILPIVLTTSVTILTVVLTVVAVYVVMVLRRLKETLDRVNDTIDLAELKINSIISPFQSLVGLSSSLGAGLKVFESFTGWLHKNNSQSK